MFLLTPSTVAKSTAGESRSPGPTSPSVNLLHGLLSPTSQDAVQLDGRGWFTSSWRYAKRSIPQPSDISCLRNGTCLIVGRVEEEVPALPNYPSGRWFPLVLQASTR